MARITPEEYWKALLICRQYAKEISEEIEIYSESKYPFEDERIECLNLSERANNLIRQFGVYSIYQLLDKVKNKDSLLAFKVMGIVSVEEICDSVKKKYGIQIGWKDQNKANKASKYSKNRLSK
ncbi:MAG: hypothetical protein IPG12_04885 [Saprospiraceae bacterium]|nr:hypothetical protein [Saprospiraceae bacterium]